MSPETKHVVRVVISLIELLVTASLVVAAFALLLWILFFHSHLSAAPAPPYRPKPIPEITEGEWVIDYGPTKTRVVLGKDNYWFCEWCGCGWHGSWKWEKKTRLFEVSESSDGTNWLNWSVKFDDKLMGNAEVGTRYVSVAMTKMKKRTKFSQFPPKVEVVD